MHPQSTRKPGPEAGPIEPRFWAKVNKDGPVMRPELGQCWVWTATHTPKGYGRFGLNRTTMIYAHRFSWQLAHGPIPEGLIVCHKCDNPPCVRPDHLFLGTHHDNHVDMAQKGRAYFQHRSWRGEDHLKAKLTRAQVDEIRVRSANGEGDKALAREFGVSKGNIYWIKIGRSWRD